MQKSTRVDEADNDKENVPPGPTPTSTLAEDERVAKALALNDKWKKNYESTKNRGHSLNAGLKERKLFFARLLRFILINTEPFSMNQTDVVQAIPLDQIPSQLTKYFPKYQVPQPQDLCPFALTRDWKTIFMEPKSSLSRLFSLLRFNDNEYVCYNEIAISLSEDEDTESDSDLDSDSSSPTPVFKIIKHCPTDAEAKSDLDLSNIDISEMLKDDGNASITDLNDEFNFNIDELVKSLDSL